MATPTTRMALSEIPGRLEQLHVATSPTTYHQIADEPTPANVLNPTIFDNPLNNIALAYYTSPIPSPDEIVIRQRGRRNITLSYSPEKCPGRSPFPKTPTKSAIIGLSTMTLRSSPRKRLDRSPIKCNINNNLMYGMSPKKIEQSNKWNGTPIVKRLKLEEKSLVAAQGSSTHIPLHIQLKGLSQDQLIGIIKNLVKDDNKIEEKIRNEFPLPDISHMENELMHIKRNIFKSLPTSRLCKKTDSTSYARAVTHLTAFKKSIFDNSKLLYDSGHWDALLDYATMSWNYVRATPIWDNNSQNAVRRHCFKILVCNCVAAIKFGGQRLGAQRLFDLERNIKEWSKDYEDILQCVNYLNQILIEIRTN